MSGDIRFFIFHLYWWGLFVWFGFYDDGAERERKGEKVLETGREREREQRREGEREAAASV